MHRAYFEFSGPPGTTLPWSLLRIVDEAGGDTGFGAVRSPVGAHDREPVEQFAAQRRLIGLTAYGTFPRIHAVFDGKERAAGGRDGQERPEAARCAAWAHCFRDPGRYLPADAPRSLISISDFTDPEWVSAEGLATPADKRWDLIYTCCPNRFNELTKNWALAKRCLARLVRDLGITALLVGRDQAPDVPDVPGLETCGELPWHELMACLSQSRVAFFPNALDASPVFLTEALCLDVPIVVNRRILGGWKYVRPATGRFFTSENDVTAAVAACLSETLAPRAWFRAVHGPGNAAERLGAFLGQVAARSPVAAGEAAPQR